METQRHLIIAKQKDQKTYLIEEKIGKIKEVSNVTSRKRKQRSWEGKAKKLLRKKDISRSLKN